MTIYNITPEEPYLESVADFVLRSYQDKISDVKIIVPTSVICAELQRIFVRKSVAGATILPSVMPLGAMSSESELVYKVPSDNIEAISYIEQKLLLIEIIEEYEGLNFSILQASYLSDQLLRLFHEIEAGKVDISALPAIVEIDSAMHWMLTAQFLTESYEKWHQRIRGMGKISPAAHQKLVLDIEVRDSFRPTIIVGITGGSKSLEEFIGFLAKSEHGVVIPPPFNLEDIESDAEPISPFYRLSKLLALPYPCTKHSGFGKKSNDKEKSYITATSELEEAELVARIAAHSSTDGTVAIVSNNRDLIALASIALQKYGIDVSNLRGEALINSKPIEFMLLIASSVLLDDVEKLAALLKSPFLACDEAYAFEIKHLRKVGVNTLSLLGRRHSTVSKGEEWFDDLKVKLEPLYDLKDAFHKFSYLLKTHLECAMEIVPQIFVGEEGAAACEFFRELVAAADNLDIVEARIYPDLIKQLLVGAKYFPKTASKIVAISPQDAALMDFDTFIIADCTEGSFPYHNPPDPWMTNKMRQQIGLKLDEEVMGEAHYYFQLLANQKRVYITSAQKSKGRENVVSRFLVSMLADLEKAGKGETLEPKYDWFISYAPYSDLILGSHTTTETLGSSPNMVSFKTMFPHSISATNIELLLRNPYGFYAKKILGLSKPDDINMEASLADFGTLVHNIIGLYTENYDGERVDKLQYFLDLSQNAFDEFHEHHKMRNWRARLKAIAEDFIDFDELRRKDLDTVYSEIYGDMVLKMGDKQIRVTAIADRIELTKSGEIYIMDYKTGAVPSMQSVKNGMSPQLMVEAIIAAEGGFKGLPTVVASKLIYVKIASSRPYFKETTINLSEEELQKHKRGLANLLGQYLNGGAEFVATPNQLYEPKYNDYKHLARRL